MPTDLNAMCDALILRVDGFLGVQNIPGIEDVTESFVRPKRANENDIQTDPMYIASCEVFNNFTTVLTSKFVVKRMFESNGDPVWRFFFKDYDNIYVNFQRIEKDKSYQFSFHLTKNSIAPVAFNSNQNIYTTFKLDQIAQMKQYAIHAMKIFSVIYVMCKRRSYGVSQWLLYDKGECIMQFYNISSEIMFKMKLDSDPANQAIVLDSYAKRTRLFSYKDQTDLPKSFINLSAFEDYVKKH